MLNENTTNVLAKLIELTSERDVSSLEIVLAQTLFELVASEAVVIYRIVDLEKQQFSARLMGESLSDEQIPPALATKLLACLNTGHHMVCEEDASHRLLLYPLMSYKNGPVAVIAVHTTDQSESMHTVTSMLLQIYQNFISLINDNERDTLTGLLNRKTFELKIGKIMAQIQSQNQRMTDSPYQRYFLAIFDIDHFKRVNDDFGHLIGDEVLLLFSRMLSSSFRDKDMIFRFGGEEFVAVFDCPDMEQMQQVLDRFREKVMQNPFPQVGRITISIGYSEIQPFDNASLIIDRADTALYYSKNNGRNQVHHYEALIADGLLSVNKIEGEVEFF